jgi:hypothetical protein
MADFNSHQLFLKDTLLSKQLLEERLGFYNYLKESVNDLIHENEVFCMHCSEDRIYCKTCVIPIIKKKMEMIFHP